MSKEITSSSKENVSDVIVPEAFIFSVTKRFVLKETADPELKKGGGRGEEGVRDFANRLISLKEEWGNGMHWFQLMKVSPNFYCTKDKLS